MNRMTTFRLLMELSHSATTEITILMVRAQKPIEWDILLIDWVAWLTYSGEMPTRSVIGGEERLIELEIMAISGVINIRILEDLRKRSLMNLLTHMMELESQKGQRRKRRRRRRRMIRRRKRKKNLLQLLRLLAKQDLLQYQESKKLPCLLLQSQLSQNNWELHPNSSWMVETMFQAKFFNGQHPMLKIQNQD